VRVLVLGSTRAVGEPEAGTVDLGARKPRSIVAALAMTPGRPVSADLLIDLVWGGEPPRAAHGALHAYLSGLRRALEPDRPARGSGGLIETTDHGYVLRVAPESVDAHAFTATTMRAGRVLAPLASQLTGAAPDQEWPTRSAVLDVLAELDGALAGWAGEPYADLPEHPDVLAARTALEQQRLAAEEARMLGLLALGEHAAVLAVTETTVGPDQLRERWWALHAAALARAGRQADALEALRTVRLVLADELGLDPGAELRALEAGLLRQDPVLDRTLGRDRAAPASPPADVPPAGQSLSRSLPAGTSVGREAERAALAACLEQARSGTAQFAQLVGEPGIGKTHLADDLITRATEAGLRVGVGRCARDNGAPPLWPFRSAFAGLGLEIDLDAGDAAAESPERRAFLLSERVSGALVDATSTGPVVLVVEDLHWADDATLRALVHLVDGCPPDRGLCVLVTRRAHPEPSGTLAALGEALARRHAVRLDLAGLDQDAARTLVGAGSHVGDGVGQGVGEGVVAGWQERSGGNPFFLIELARLGPDHGGAVPGTVLDVVGRRLSELPGAVLDRLQTAAAVGPRFTLAVVAAADDAAPDQVAEQLDVAVDAGLVVEHGPEDYAFAHALTQEAVLASMGGSRTARRHARIAHALQADAGLSDPRTRVADLARHWLAAGPSHVESAWRAARAAADEALSLASYPEAMRLRAAAVDAHRRVVGGADEVRYDLLLELATDAALAAQWPRVEAAAFEAMTLGRTMGSPVHVGRAAAALTRYCVWLPHVIDVVFEDAVDDLRWALAHVGDDPATRCRLQLSLAVELYYEVGTRAERRALAVSGMALARSVDDPDLLWEACGAACMVAWNPADLEDRLAWAEEGVAAARAAGDTRAEAVLLVQLAMARAELGDRAGWEAASSAAADIADRERLVYVSMTLHWQWMALAALRGRTGEAEAAYEALVASIDQVAVPSQEMMAPFAWVAVRLWDPRRLDEVVASFSQAHEENAEGGVVVHELLARTGRVEELRRALADFPVPVEEEEYWSTLADWSREAEAAAVAGDEALARRAIEVLAPYAGRLAVSGAVGVAGVVDGALALAHATAGDQEVATRLADAAAAQAREWGFDAYLAVLDRHRARLGI
jgi:DNA-binding SARP family transcriptional activator